jgi:hypothetical protein
MRTATPVRADQMRPLVAGDALELAVLGAEEIGRIVVVGGDGDRSRGRERPTRRRQE